MSPDVASVTLPGVTTAMWHPVWRLAATRPLGAYTGLAMGSRLLTLAVILLGWALPLEAQQSVELEFNAGRVTLNAQNASARVILSEWARLGGATIINAEDVVGPAMTLELVDMPERQALDIILRSTAGYLLAPRRAGATGISVFDRVVILATSVGPRNPPPAPVASTSPQPILRRPPVILPQQPADPDGLMGGGADDAAPGFDPFDPFGGQGAGAPDPDQLGDPNLIPQPLVGQDPSNLLDPNGNGPSPQETEPAGVAPSPSNPFGIPFGSSSTPGMVTPVPNPQQ